MMKWFVSGLLSMLFSLCIFSAHAEISPTEQKFDKIMSTYAGKLKLAFQEQDDQKTLALLRNASKEATAEINNIKPELKQWVKSRKALTGAQRQEEKERFENKPYIKTIMELMFNPGVIRRLEVNPALRDALKTGESILTDFKVEAEDELAITAEE